MMFRESLSNNCLNKNLPEGNTQISWDGTGPDQRKLQEGVYFYRLQSGKYSQSGKIILY